MINRGNYFSPSDHFDCDIEKGVIRNRAGKRVVGLTRDFLLGFRDSLEHECGPAADAVLETCGKTFGKLFTKRMNAELASYYEEEVDRLPLAVLDALLQQALATYGWGRATMDYRRHAEGVIVVEVESAIMSSLIDESERPVDPLLAGFLGAIFAELSQQELACVQTSCPTLGSDTSRFVVALTERVDKIRPMVAAGKTHDDVIASLSKVRAAA